MPALSASVYMLSELLTSTVRQGKGKMYPDLKGRSKLSIITGGVTICLENLKKVRQTKSSQCL